MGERRRSLVVSPSAHSGARVSVALSVALAVLGPLGARADPRLCPGGVEDGDTIVLYHQTSPRIAKIILEEGFKPGWAGFCGGGIYFAASPEATFWKATGPDSNLGAVLEVTVDMGKVCVMGDWCTHKRTGWAREHIWSQGYDSIRFNPHEGFQGGDDSEFVIMDPKRVRSIRISHSDCGKEGKTPVIPGTVCLGSSSNLPPHLATAGLLVCGVGLLSLTACVVVCGRASRTGWRSYVRTMSDQYPRRSIDHERVPTIHGPLPNELEKNITSQDVHVRFLV